MRLYLYTPKLRKRRRIRPCNDSWEQYLLCLLIVKVILMTTGQEDDMNIVRLDRTPQSKLKESGQIYHVADGQFKGIVVKQTMDEGQSKRSTSRSVNRIVSQ